MKEPEELSRINITADDIAYAQRQNRWACAIVRSIQRARPEAIFVRADKEVIAFTERGHRYTFNTPDTAIERVIKPLDKGQSVMPTSFDLGPPTVKQAQRMSDEKKTELRSHKRNVADRQRTAGMGKKPGQGERTHDRFCD